MSVTVAVYDVGEGWTSLVDYFRVNVNTSWPSVNSSFTGARSTHSTMYVLKMTLSLRRRSILLNVV